MNKIKRIDWLEFIFTPESMTIPEGYRLDVVKEQYLNYDLHRVYHVVNVSPEYPPVSYEVCQSVSRGTYFVQWTGLTVPHDPLNTLKAFALFFEILDEEITIKRIDIAFDLCCEIPDIDRKNAKTRCKVYGRFDSNGTTHYFGKSPLFLRIYNKLAELEAGRPDRLESYHNLTNFDEEAITRVEFQIRSEALQKRGIRTAEQLFNLLPQFEAYLVREWFWIPLTKHKGEQRFSPFWQEVVNLTQNEYHLEPLKKIAADCEALRKTGFSVLGSAYVGSLNDLNDASPEGFRDFVKEHIEEFKPTQGWTAFWESKQ
ncbi:MAG: hypothetical protein O4860_13695 [Trichodesmium sp. St2_bin2_1]|nr:hypothetical protein [Trichodesmium sp. St2_bin2_1]